MCWRASIARATATRGWWNAWYAAPCWDLVALAVVLVGAGWLFNAVPTGFLPSEDQGAIFGEIVLPEGASVNRTDAVAKQVEEIIRHTKGVAGVTEVVGYSLLDGQVKSNSAMLIMTLEPFGHREDPALSVDGIITHLRGQFDAIREANVIAYNLPPIIGLGTGSGFEYQLESLSGSSPADLAAVARGLVFAANQEPALEAVFTTYAANTPQLYLDIDREKLQTLGVDLSEVFNRPADPPPEWLQDRQSHGAGPDSGTRAGLAIPGLRIPSDPGQRRVRR